MNLLRMFRPSRKKTIITIVLFAIYMIFIYSGMMITFDAEILECTDKPRHIVNAYYPGATSQQVCATTFELVLGYLYLLLLPLIILFLFVNLTIEGINCGMKK